MSKIKLFTQTISIFLIVSIFFTACDVPDISKFTEQSAEMTRGIRHAVKDTDSLLETAATSALLEDKTKEAFRKHAKNYKAAMEPTLETLDSLDAYLDALNALAQANKKSSENSKALVGAVSNLATSASKLLLVPPTGADGAIPASLVKIATGVLAVAEQFRTARSFKKRVNLAADIVEGRFEEIPKVITVDGQEKTVIESRKLCTDKSRAGLESIGKQLTDTLKRIDENNKYSEVQKETLKKSAIENYDRTAYTYGCGVIDLLKFTVQDLKRINNEVSVLLLSNYRENKMDTVILYRKIDDNNFRTQREIGQILTHKDLVSQIKDYDFQFLIEKNANEKQRLKKEILRRIKKDKETLDGIFMLDGRIKETAMSEIIKCDNGRNKQECIGMKKFVDLFSADTANDAELTTVYQNLAQSLSNFYTGNSYIEAVFDARKDQLFAENRAYLSERERIKPDYDKTTSDLADMMKKQKQLNSALTSSVAALNAWMTTHANLRVTVNTKKPLSVANLAGKVKEIISAMELSQ